MTLWIKWTTIFCSHFAATVLLIGVQRRVEQPIYKGALSLLKDLSGTAQMGL
jgi:hypothetical protein